jgi:hypothetical protein
MHIKRPDMQNIDSIMHVTANRSATVAGLALFYNPSLFEQSARFKLPMYYTGETEAVHLEWEGNGSSTKHALLRDYSVPVSVSLGPREIGFVVVHRGSSTPSSLKSDDASVNTSGNWSCVAFNCTCKGMGGEAHRSPKLFHRHCIACSLSFPSEELILYYRRTNMRPSWQSITASKQGSALAVRRSPQSTGGPHRSARSRPAALARLAVAAAVLGAQRQRLAGDGPARRLPTASGASAARRRRRRCRHARRSRPRLGIQTGLQRTS